MDASAYDCVRQPTGPTRQAEPEWGVAGRTYPSLQAEFLLNSPRPGVIAGGRARSGGDDQFSAIVTASLHRPAGTDWFGLFCYIPDPGSENRCPRVDGGNHQKCYYLPQRKFAMLGAQLDAPDYLSHLHKILEGIDLTALQRW